MTSTRSAHRSPRIGLLQVCAAGVIWGTGRLVVTVLHERDGLGAMTASAWRMALTAVALIGFAVMTRRSDLVLTTLRSHPAPRSWSAVNALFCREQTRWTEPDEDEQSPS
jgi:DME family drug/metabolite transporter